MLPISILEFLLLSSVSLPFFLAYRFSRTISKTIFTRAQTIDVSFSTFIARLRLDRVLHHSSKELRKRLATDGRPFIRLRFPRGARRRASRLDPCISELDLGAARGGSQQSVAFSFRGPIYRQRRRRRRVETVWRTRTSYYRAFRSRRLSGRP